MQHAHKERFEKNFIVTPGCWLWQNSLGAYGYGRFYVNKRSEAAHRVSYDLYVGPIPLGLVVRHKCDVRSCVNPDHLEIGTHADNSKDCVERGRTAKGEKHGKTNLTNLQVDEMRRLVLGKVDLKDVAALYNVSHSCAWYATKTRPTLDSSLKDFKHTRPKGENSRASRLTDVQIKEMMALLAAKVPRKEVAAMYNVVGRTVWYAIKTRNLTTL